MNRNYWDVVFIKHLQYLEILRRYGDDDDDDHDDDDHDHHDHDHSCYCYCCYYTIILTIIVYHCNDDA